jgi:hypothetical protein
METFPGMVRDKPGEIFLAGWRTETSNEERLLEDFTTLVRRVNGLQVFQPTRWETTLRPISEGVDGQDFLFEHHADVPSSNGPGR